jgi:Rieske Fe-S protein
MNERRSRRRNRAVDAVADGQAIPAGPLDEPEDVDALRAAIELRAGQPAADLPSAEFVARLRRQVAEDTATEVAPPRRLSRRALLSGAGAVAAGAVAIGVVADRTLLEGSTSRTAKELDPNDGAWLAVATSDEMIAGGARRFSTPDIIGFVSGAPGAPVAVSASCTHMGCILRQNASAGRLDCPCHSTAFAYDGKLLFSQLADAPAPLTKLQARDHDGTIEVFVPRV